MEAWFLRALIRRLQEPSLFSFEEFSYINSSPRSSEILVAMVGVVVVGPVGILLAVDNDETVEVGGVSLLGSLSACYNMRINTR